MKRLALALAMMMLPACLLGYEPGVAVELSLEGARASGESADLARFDSIAGSVHVASIELVPCPTSTMTALREWLGPSRARAHEVEGLGVGAIPIGVDERDLGVLSPGPGRYCALALTVVPASEAEGGLEPGETLALRGDATLDAPFEWIARGPGSLEVEVPLVDSMGRADPITLDADHREARVALSVDWSAVLEGVALSERDEAELALDIVVRLRGALRARTVPADVAH